MKEDLTHAHNRYEFRYEVPISNIGKILRRSPAPRKLIESSPCSLKIFEMIYTYRHIHPIIIEHNTVEFLKFILKVHLTIRIGGGYN